MQIRAAIEQGFEPVWEIFRAVVKTGDTYTFSPETPKTDLKKYWFADYMHTFVAEEGDRIRGTFICNYKQKKQIWKKKRNQDLRD